MPPASNKKRITTLKKILHAGKGAPINFTVDTKVLINYEVFVPPKVAATNKNDETDDQPAAGLFPEDTSLYKLVDSTKKKWPNGYGKPLELVIGRKFQLPLLEECVKAMLVDEVSQFDVYDPTEVVMLPMLAKKLRDIARSEEDPNYKEPEGQHHCCAGTGPIPLGYAELDELMANPRPLRIVIHLIQVFHPDQYKQDNWQLNDAQKLSGLGELRASGNQLFTEGKFKEASEKYMEALGIIDKLLLKEKPNDPEWHKLDQMNVPFHLNLSQCFLNLGEFYKAIECASEVLNRDEKNEKALFRRIKAEIATWDFDRAESDLNKLEKLGPSSTTPNSVIASFHEEINQKRSQKNVDDKKVFKAMFK